MKSNVCKIDNGTKDLAAILKESEKVAVYNELTHKQTLQLRLICEEIDGMLPNIVDNFSGDLWIEVENGLCKVNISIDFKGYTAEKKKELVAISKNKKNAAVTGIAGKIRSALENIFLEEGNIGEYEYAVGSCYYASEYYDCMQYSSVWTLEQYRKSVKQEEKTEQWDELEKSVIASVADDVIVGVKGNHADIIVIKKFA